MGRFYFDFHDTNGIVRDDTGEELSSAGTARDMALRIIGQAVRDLTLRPSEGLVVIEVCDGEGALFKVSASVEATSLKE